MHAFQPQHTALLIGDMQNGFLHPQGCYARGGASDPAFRAIVPAVRAAADALRAAGGLIVASLFTLVPGRGGEPLISPHLGRLRPFLRRGDFAPGSFDQQLVEALQPADCLVEKVAYSAFYNSRLEFVLRRQDIRTLVCCGVVTQGGVASTARDAHTRDFQTLVLEDACASSRPEAHEAALADLRQVVGVIRTAELVAQLRGAASR
jgi:ureidoacrylate peracid hydrolase